MVQVLPYVARESCFTLKGGTAINLFVRDLPRLSVDIDLVYTPLKSREDALSDMQAALNRIADDIRRSIPDVKVTPSAGQSPKLFARKDELLVKIEINTVIRGLVFPSTKTHLTKKAETMFQMSVALSVASVADLYGGKLCAALDRQHPRDLFDVKLLLENEGITDDIRKAFIVYLASHDRTMHELLSPSIKDVKKIFDVEFSGMTTDPIALSELIDVQKRLGKMILNSLTGREKQFLLSFKKGDPQWQLLDHEGIENLPAIRWKLLNIRKMNKSKHLEQVEKLQSVLDL